MAVFTFTSCAWCGVSISMAFRKRLHGQSNLARQDRKSQTNVKSTICCEAHLTGRSTKKNESGSKRNLPASTKAPEIGKQPASLASCLDVLEGTLLAPKAIARLTVPQCHWSNVRSIVLDACCQHHMHLFGGPSEMHG